uniref:Phycoerythrin alpha-1 subunit n=2 Tax=Hemiselmis andersenii TaxID=464988 RepID=PHEA1_HEMAN|nr:RecName: Full=Phycoerythrin alpha-1 subunit; AltName: Full=Phycoerythrin PE555 alpha-1 subunit; Short=PE555A-1 [Hemiselmis andersenii]AGY96993.1 phycoerythrin550 alpha subunit [Hemiselmis andersenii]
MYTKIALLGLVGSAAAFNAPMMTVRRDAIATGAAAAVVAPMLRPAGAAMKKDSKAPCVEVFDERDGCKAAGTQKASGDDGFCVKVSMKAIGFNAAEAASVTKNYGIKRFGAKSV